MSFVPIIVTPPPPPSRQARELEQRIGDTIATYAQEHPELRRTDIRRALGMASSRVGSGAGAWTAILLGLLAVGLTVLTVLFIRAN